MYKERTKRGMSLLRFDIVSEPICLFSDPIRSAVIIKQRLPVFCHPSNILHINLIVRAHSDFLASLFFPRYHSKGLLLLDLHQIRCLMLSVMNVFYLRLLHRQFVGSKDQVSLYHWLMTIIARHSI